jgi:rhodanese-related sulfurtransferase
MAHAAKFLSLVNDAKKRVKETNVADVKRRMDAGEKFVLVDVREESEWARGHFPEQSIWEKGSLSGTSNKKCPRRGQR